MTWEAQATTPARVSLLEGNSDGVAFASMVSDWPEEVRRRVAALCLASLGVPHWSEFPAGAQRDAWLAMYQRIESPLA